MKMIKHCMLVSLLCSSGVMTHGSLPGSLVIDETFIKEHSVSKELAHKLDQHSEQLTRLVEEIQCYAAPKTWCLDLRLVTGLLC